MIGRVSLLTRLFVLHFREITPVTPLVFLYLKALFAPRPHKKSIENHQFLLRTETNTLIPE